MNETAAPLDHLQSRQHLIDWVATSRGRHQRIALVPTMGALHAGHLALITHARHLADQVLVSIFVNPTQFGPTEDYQQYPRPLEQDLALCRQAAANACFTPSVADMYPLGLASDTRVRPPAHLTESLCGAYRPGHFEGVATVVTKLLTLSGADVAVFGLKDFQQTAVIKAVCADLGLSTQVALHPTLRDTDGVALSSRNRYLTPRQRQIASMIPAALAHAWQHYHRGERDARELLSGVQSLLGADPALSVQYVALVDADTLRAVAVANDNTVLAIAAFLDTTRLIDNHRLGEPLPEALTPYLTGSAPASICEAIEP